MNKLSNDSAFVRDIDLLVDGELPEERRRKLLSELDSVHGGWRRLALAFVEAQTMQESLFGFSLDHDQRTPPADQPMTRRAARPSHLTFLAAIAASFLVALVVGWSIRNGQIPVTGQPDVRQAPEVRVPDTVKKSPPAVLAVGDPSIEDLGEATLVVNSPGGSQQRVRLPVIYAQDEEPLRQLSRRRSVPPHVVQALQRLGYRVEQERSVVRRDLHDGRQLFVPVDQVNVNYVGEPTYQ